MPIKRGKYVSDDPYYVAGTIFGFPDRLMGGLGSSEPLYRRDPQVSTDPYFGGVLGVPEVHVSVPDFGHSILGLPTVVVSPDDVTGHTSGTQSGTNGTVQWQPPLGVTPQVQIYPEPDNRIGWPMPSYPVPTTWVSGRDAPVQAVDWDHYKILMDARVGALKPNIPTAPVQIAAPSPPPPTIIGGEGSEEMATDWGSMAAGLLDDYARMKLGLSGGGATFLPPAVAAGAGTVAGGAIAGAVSSALSGPTGWPGNLDITPGGYPPAKGMHWNPRTGRWEHRRRRRRKLLTESDFAALAKLKSLTGNNEAFKVAVMKAVR